MTALGGLPAVIRICWLKLFAATPSAELTEILIVATWVMLPLRARSDAVCAESTDQSAIHFTCRKPPFVVVHGITKLHSCWVDLCISGLFR